MNKDFHQTMNCPLLNSAHRTQDTTSPTSSVTGKTSNMAAFTFGMNRIFGSLFLVTISKACAERGNFGTSEVPFRKGIPFTFDALQTGTNHLSQSLTTLHSLYFNFTCATPGGDSTLADCEGLPYGEAMFHEENLLTVTTSQTAIDYSLGLSMISDKKCEA